MRRMVIYWQHDSKELHFVPDGAMATCGNDGMEFICSEATAQSIRDAVAGHADALVLDTDEPASARDVELAIEWANLPNVWQPFKTTEELFEYLGESI